VADSDLRLRPATTDDGDRVLEWSNDPVTRAASFSTAPITADEHARWFADCLRGVRALYIAELSGRPIGMARLEAAEPGAAAVSLTLAAESRGCGLATPLLAALVSAARASGFDRLVALVRADNAPSRRLFERSGFAESRPEPVRGAEAIRYELRILHSPATGKEAKQTRG